MVNDGDATISPQNSEDQKSDQVVQNSSACGVSNDNSLSLFSPRFRSVAAMAGWDEEALMIASLVVEDTPDRQHFKQQKKRPDHNAHNNFKTPPTNSRRKRRAQRRSPISLPVAVLDLEDDALVEPPKESDMKIDMGESKKEEKESGAQGTEEQSSNVSNSSAVHCMDRLREELSCAICLDICFEPSTTPCGHSFCKKCLRSAADKCGKKCPKCRQLISNGRSCTVNTVLWNTIQLLFPQEIEARKAAFASNDRQNVQLQSPVSNNARTRRVQELSSRRAAESGNGNARTRHAQELSNRGTESVGIRHVPELGSRGAEPGTGSSSRRRSHQGTRRRSIRPPSMTVRRRNELPSQDEDAALALRLQREEFMGVYSSRGSSRQEYTSSLALARANLRAMASRAIRGL